MFAMANPKNAEAALSAMSVLASRKGRVLDAISGRIEALKTASGAAGSLIRKWREASDRYARVTFASSRGDPTLLPRIQSARDAAQDAEAAVYLNIPAMRRQLASVSDSSILKAIPKNSSLLDFVRYTPLEIHGSAPVREDGKARYAAVVVSRGGVVVKDIGSASLVDQEISDFSAALRDPSSHTTTALATTLYNSLVAPLTSIDQNADLIICPDGQLNLVPFAALIGPDGRYLLERHAITYVTSARDLLNRAEFQLDRSRVEIIANPDFGSVPGGGVASVSAFRPLPGTAIEAQDIARELGLSESQSVEGLAASKAYVKALRSPSVLHFAGRSRVQAKWVAGGGQSFGS